MYDSVDDNNIFPSFFCSCIPQLDMMELLEEAYIVQKQCKSEEVSNEGGYHSPTFSGERFSKLKDIVQEFCNDLLHQKGLGLKVSEIEYWCNINKCYNYNVMHNHGRADLIGIYYLQVPDNSGDICFIRNDGSQYCNLYSNRHDMLEYIVEPEAGRLYVLPGHLWHYVTGSNSVRDRISISFNIYT